MDCNNGVIELGSQLEKSYSPNEVILDFDGTQKTVKMSNLKRWYKPCGIVDKKELKEAKEYARLAEDDSKQKDAQIKKLTEENATKYNELQSNFTKEINKVKDEKEKEIAKLNKQINDLMKRISVYEPSLSGDVGDDKYFGIEGPILNETLSDDAPIIGRVDVDGNAIYQFNVEKGPHKSMCQKIAELEQFFDIVDRIEGANHISMCEWGKAKYNNGTMVPIEPKAKIKLTRE